MTNDSKQPAADRTSLALIIRGQDRPGLLHALTGVIFAHRGNITLVEIVERGNRSAVYFEIDPVSDPDALIVDLGKVESVEVVEPTLSMFGIYGKRVIVVGGGAQVGQVA